MEGLTKGFNVYFKCFTEMYFHKVTIAAIFICQLTLIPETLMSSNEAVFHVAIDSLTSISENCSHEDTEIKKTYSLAISDLTSVFYHQNEKITELEVNNVHLKDQIEYLKEKLTKRGDNLHSRIKREERLADYKEWAGFPGPNRKRRISYDQDRDGMKDSPYFLNFDEHNNYKKMINNQKRIDVNRIPQAPHVLQRLYRNDLKDYLDPSNHVQMKEPRVQHRSGKEGYINSKMKPLAEMPRSTSDSEPDKTMRINVIDGDGKLLPGMVIHPSLPGGMCQIVTSEEFENKKQLLNQSKNLSKDRKKNPKVPSIEESEEFQNKKKSQNQSKKVSKNKKKSPKVPSKEESEEFKNKKKSTNQSQNVSGTKKKPPKVPSKEENISKNKEEHAKVSSKEEDINKEKDELSEEEDHIHEKSKQSKQLDEGHEKSEPDDLDHLHEKSKQSKQLDHGREKLVLDHLPYGPWDSAEEYHNQKYIQQEPVKCVVDETLSSHDAKGVVSVSNEDRVINSHVSSSSDYIVADNSLESSNIKSLQEDKKFYIHYIGVKGDSLDKGAKTFWVYPSNQQEYDSALNDLKGDEKNRRVVFLDNRGEEMMLDELLYERDSPQLVGPQGEIHNDRKHSRIHQKSSQNDNGGEEMVLNDLLYEQDSQQIVGSQGEIHNERKPSRIHQKHFHNIEEDKISDSYEELVPDGEVDEMQSEQIRDDVTSVISERKVLGGGISKRPEGLTFATTITFPHQYLLSEAKPITDQNQISGIQKGMNVYGNYIALTVQKPELQPDCESNDKKQSNNDISSGNRIIRITERTGYGDNEPEDLESSCPQLTNLNDSSCNCTPCNGFVTELNTSLVHPECKNFNENSSLHEVVKMGCSNLVDKIVKKTNVNQVNDEGLTPLQVAAERGYTDMMNTLIKEGADINAVDNKNNTALHYCATGGSTNACSLLLSKGINVKAQNVNQATALHIAVWKGNYELVNRLLMYKDSFEITDNFGRSASDLAHEMNNDDITELLEKNGIKSKNPRTAQNACGRYPTNPSELATCTEPSHSSTVSDSKVSVTTAAPTVTITTKGTKKTRRLATTTSSTTSEAPDKVEVSGRQLTNKEKELFEVSKGNDWFGGKARKLCVEGMDINVKDIDNNSSTALHFAASIGVKLTTLILIRCGADVNLRDIDGNTPLHLAVMNGKYWVANILLHNRANPFAVNNNGDTPQKLAHNRTEFAMRGLFDARLLKWYNPERKLKKEEETIHKWAKEGYYLGISLKCTEGNDINIKNVDNHLSTALHLAVSASKNNLETVLTLIRCGSNIHSLDRNENTPLHLAIINKQADVVVTLLENSADPLVPNKDGKTAYQLAQESDDPLIKDTFTSQRYSWYMRHFFDKSQTISDP
ncbi:unnamed protein product [Nezara viridula]|uniref:Uncharacterized protein n=2 Tax=Nezara viridula TaxID=85310 RepID=A0A9P0HS20_NEZVI|nr:unnamed protein product [Nezara viridula]